MSDFDREIFEEAFTANASTCRYPCKCGVIYWDGYNGGYTWEEGEKEELERNPKAKELEHAVSLLNIEGREFVADCECWVPRAKQIWEWIDRNDHAIASVLNLKKRRAEIEAKNMPEVKA